MIFQSIDILILLNVTLEDPKFDMGIKEDVYEECSKYGHVKHIHVDK